MNEHGGYPPQMDAAAGFTLIELLAVAGILAVLVAIAIPNLFSAFERARVGKAIHEVGVIRDAVETYRVLHDGKLPLAMADLVPNHLAVAPVDPWGRAYVYGNFAVISPGQRRKDGPLVPINREYDIYSVGKDGASTPTIRSGNSADDVIMANDGSFVGLAKDY